MEFEDKEKNARRIYNLHISEVYYELEKHRGVITKEYARSELIARLKKESRSKKIKKVPIVGKYFKQKNKYAYYSSSALYKFILSLMENLEVGNLNFDILENIIKENKNDLYENCYRNDYIKLVKQSQEETETTI